MNATARIAAKNNTPLVFKNHVPVADMIDTLRDIQSALEGGQHSYAEQRFRHFCLAQGWNAAIDSGLSRFQEQMRIAFVMTINGWMMRGTEAIALGEEVAITEARAKLIHDCAEWLITIIE